MIYQFVGWHHNNWNDRIWGIYKINRSNQSSLIFQCLTFWGVRKSTLSTKCNNYYGWEIRELIKNKIYTGYDEFQPEEYSAIYDEFDNDLSKMLTWVALKNSV